MAIRAVILCLAAAVPCLTCASCASDPGGGEAGVDADGEDADGAVLMTPEALWGVFDVAFDGDWVGTCRLTIAARNAELRALHAQYGEMVLEVPGPHFTSYLAEQGGTWSFPFSFGVLLPPDGAEETHSWVFEIPESSVGPGGFTGTYSRESASTGSSTGPATGTRR